jgi:hypothetical protein
MRRTSEASPQHTPDNDQNDSAIVQLLGHRYGDGLVYLQDRSEKTTFDKAVSLGLVSREGYLTPEGRSLLARCHLD